MSTTPTHVQSQGEHEYHAKPPFHEDDERYHLALARIRTLLAHIAPEIPEDEIVLNARLREDLRLDTVSIWALATQLEALARVEITDHDIRAATDIESLCTLALTEVPADLRNKRNDSAPASSVNRESEDDDHRESSGSGAQTSEDLASAAADLAAFFNQ
ncbi:MAG: hypothetical protein PUK40_02190 [Actinomycetaceae bacterium]|nr:hypothetical protein [Arcanobacterium sp.]MDD7504751.1 hypothetical protein [Actinomycetaceae bacterium]MDY6143578.1 hypothetical protein [Arcanobacterium sp.]